MYNFKITTFLILFTFGFSESFSIKPVLFSQYLSSGSDWMIKDSPISIYGAGLDFFYQNKNTKRYLARLLWSWRHPSWEIFQQKSDQKLSNWS